MALETGTYIEDLVITNPTGVDSRRQGDDHIRLLKTTLQNTFPNLDCTTHGAVDVTAEEINRLDGVTPGTALANSALVLGATKNVDTIDVAKDGLKIGGSAMTCTAAELNKLDGVTLTTDQINNAVQNTGDTITGDLIFSDSGTDYRGIRGAMAGSDQWCVRGFGTGTDAGALEIATGDNNSEPIYVRQYTGTFGAGAVAREAALLDASGNTSFPGRVTVDSLTIGGTPLTSSATELNLLYGLGTGDVGFPTGTKMLFQQTLAPTGWTKDGTHNNKALRITSGTAGTGGTVAFEPAFSNRTSSETLSTGTVQGTSLSIAQIPSHRHAYTTKVTGSGETASVGSFIQNGIGYTGYTGGSGGDGSAASTHSHTLTMNSHTHDINIDVQFVDVIIATKD